MGSKQNKNRNNDDRNKGRNLRAAQTIMFAIPIFLLFLSAIAGGQAPMKSESVSYKDEHLKIPVPEGTQDLSTFEIQWYVSEGRVTISLSWLDIEDVESLLGWSGRKRKLMKDTSSLDTTPPKETITNVGPAIRFQTLPTPESTERMVVVLIQVIDTRFLSVSAILPAKADYGPLKSFLDTFLPLDAEQRGNPWDRIVETPYFRFEVPVQATWEPSYVFLYETGEMSQRYDVWYAKETLSVENFLELTPDESIQALQEGHALISGQQANTYKAQGRTSQDVPSLKAGMTMPLGGDEILYIRGSFVGEADLSSLWQNFLSNLQTISRPTARPATNKEGK